MLLYEDDDWLAVDKPTGLATHSAKPGDAGAAEWLALHKGKYLHICSRLDKGTSGVLLFAKNPKASKRAQHTHEQRKSQKTYRFISKRLHGNSHSKSTSWQQSEPLAGKECSTFFRLVAEGSGYYCYEAVISRGRTHQIRQHAAISGVPILGDDQYGDAAFPRLCLHCCTVKWPDVTGLLTSPQPDSFSLLLEGKSGHIVNGAIAWERRMGWPAMVSNSYRLIQRGEIELEVSIDLYGSFLSISGFSDTQNSAILHKKLQPLLRYLSGKVHWQGGVLRHHARNPHHKKLVHDVIRWGEPVPKSILALEDDLAFSVNLGDSQHVGLFLDQRDSRRHIRRICHGRRVANLFAFTCSFSCAALKGGAEVVFSVDLAASALARGKENFAINGLNQDGRGKFIQEDVSKWLSRQERKHKADPVAFSYWDLIICDPPVFASGGKGRTFHVEKQWPELARQVRLILSAKGIALFANNHRSGNASYYQAELQKHFRLVTLLSPPLDFPVLTGKPEHIRIYWCEV